MDIGQVKELLIIQTKHGVVRYGRRAMSKKKLTEEHGIKVME
jgi:hypothetical protein